MIDFLAYLLKLFRKTSIVHIAKMDDYCCALDQHYLVNQRKGISFASSPISKDRHDFIVPELRQNTRLVTDRRIVNISFFRVVDKGIETLYGEVQVLV